MTNFYVEQNKSKRHDGHRVRQLVLMFNKTVQEEKKRTEEEHVIMKLPSHFVYINPTEGGGESCVSHSLLH